MGHSIRVPVLLAALLILSMTPASRAQDVPLSILSDWTHHNDAGWNYLNRGNYPRAEEHFRLAIDLIRPYQERGERLLARSYGDLARALYHEGRYAEAEPLAKWALSVREDHPGVKPSDVFLSLYTLALIHIAQDHFNLAEPLLQRALAIQEKEIGPNHVQTAATIDVLAGVLVQERKFAEAERLYKRALAIYSRFDPELNLDLAGCAGRYAAMLGKLGRDFDARKLRELAEAILKRVQEKDERDRDRRPRPEFRGFK